MKLGYELKLQQTQKLIMTPELRQAIQILQLTSYDLNQTIDNELSKNPVLEREEVKTEVNEKPEKNDQIEWDEYFQHSDFTSKSLSYSYNNEEDYNYEKFVSNNITLKEHLLIQLNVSSLNNKQREMGEYIIECINEDGYFTASIDDIAKNFNVNNENIETILNIIQSFDPLGVGARDIKECILIQLKQLNKLSDLIENIIINHLNDLAENRFNNISKKLDITIQEIQQVKDMIKTLEPKPGRIFERENNVRYVVPDIFIDYEDGEFIIRVNDVSAPRLRINKYYKNILINSKKGSDANKFLRNNLDAASFLIRSIEQRRDTLYNVVSAIVKHQKDFFIKGIVAMKPLTLKDIAGEIDVHESTVSRAVNGKYAQTPKGTFELKFFFKSGVSSSSGESFASDSIKEAIKELIEKENKSKPISDQAIANKLKERGISISRRTVAKYRDSLRIPSSSKRKRY